MMNAGTIQSSPRPAGLSARFDTVAVRNHFTGRPKARRRVLETPKQWGPRKWLELHTQKRYGRAWLERFINTLPAGSCECKQHFRAVVGTDPPPADDAPIGDWHRATWRWHNAVNVNLGYPELPWAEAAALYEWE